ILAQLCTAQGKLAFWRGDLENARSCHGEAMKWADTAGNDWARLRSHINIADVARIQGNHEVCKQHASEIIRIAPLVGMDSDAGLGYAHLAAAAELENNLEEAEGNWKTSRELFEAASDNRNLAVWARERGRVKERMGDAKGAREYYREWLAWL